MELLVSREFYLMKAGCVLTGVSVFCQMLFGIFDYPGSRFVFH